MTKLVIHRENSNHFDLNNTILQIFPLYRDFQLSKLADNDGFNEYPNFFHIIDVEPNECLLLEDLCARGFSTINRRTEEITADHVRLVMQGLAKFHAISFALKDQQPAKFDELTRNLDEVFICESNSTLRNSMSLQSKLLLDAVSDDQVLLAKIQKFYEQDALDTAINCLSLESTGSASVIAYGDVHQGNIMFKYDDNARPIETRFVDWQAVRHSSPIIDITFFMFCCTTKELRDDHYDEFLKVYHKTLCRHVRR